MTTVLRPCPPQIQIYVQLVAGYNPAAQIERKGVTPYPEDMLPMHEAFAARVEYEVLRGAPETPEFTLVRQELALFQGKVAAVRAACEVSERRLAAASPGGTFDAALLPKDDPAYQAEQRHWGDVTSELDCFLNQRRSLATLAWDRGRHLAYLATAVREDLDLAPIVAGIRVFE